MSKQVCDYEKSYKSLVPAQTTERQQIEAVVLFNLEQDIGGRRASLTGYVF
jgi:hypothetical protein